MGLKFKIESSEIKKKAQSLKKEVGALYLAYKRPDVPFYAKLVSIIVIGYALSPIDLIPDFIPVVGYLDDLILVPMGIAFAIKLIPKEVMNECREQSENLFIKNKKSGIVAGIVIICIWILIILYIIMKIFKKI